MEFDWDYLRPLYPWHFREQYVKAKNDDDKMKVITRGFLTVGGISITAWVVHVIVEKRQKIVSWIKSRGKK